MKGTSQDEGLTGMTDRVTRRGFLTGAGGSAPAAAAEPGVAAIGDACLAGAGIHCQSCGDACPEAAIRFRPRLGGPPLPEVAPDRCTGCGDCAAVCPADAVTLQPPMRQAPALPVSGAGHG